MKIEEVKKILWDNFNEIDWERYDFVDPPYVYAVSGQLEVDGYVFDIDGDEIVNDGYEIRDVVCTCPDGTIINF